jgi:hypothetical protein
MRRPQQLCSCTGHVRAGCPATRNRCHRIGMAIGDLLFLALIGAATMAAMHLAHMIEWAFVVELAIGMTGAMLVQVILAWLAAPLLGSIETMAPSMLLAMIVPMSLCLLHGSGRELTWAGALGLGAAAGVLAFSLLTCYGASCRRWALMAESSTHGGSHP